jgi:hypothetical protein
MIEKFDHAPENGLKIAFQDTEIRYGQERSWTGTEIPVKRG